ncbi:MAG: RNA polymerase factor sigma-54 [Desulfobacterales bacterium]
MGLGLRQQLKLTQQLVMTPQLQMAIKLLQMSRLELVEAINQELEQNPTLEESLDPPDDHHEDPTAPDSAPNESSVLPEVTINEKIPDDQADWNNYLDEYNSPGRMNYESEKRGDIPSFESFLTKKESLKDHLLWQLLMTNPSPVEERIGSSIIGNLNADGYLDIAFEELVEISEADAEAVTAVLKKMQTFDPIGVCARDLKECLLIQSSHFNLENTIVSRIITDHLNHLENKNYKAVARALKISIDEVVKAVNIIKDLEPRPGREFSDEEPHYIVPDIYVYKLENEFVIMLNEDGMPRLQINSYYKNAVKRNEVIQDHVRSYLQDKMRSAAWLIRSIHQRQKTIYKVMESILKFQRTFFENGVEDLKPMVLRDVAEDIGMHESTISRVTTNKYVHTPQGIFELKYFFNSSIKGLLGESMSSASVQNRIRQLIDAENPKKPLSDQKISKMLNQQLDITIARRTVAKYREIMKILPSNKRKQY